MIINSEQSLSDHIIQVKADFKKHKWLQIKVSKGSRTLKQNAWIYKAYEMLSKQGDMTYIEYIRYCKYTFGLKILFAKYPDMRERFVKIKRMLGYEEMLEMMDRVNVTSDFDVEEGSQYINEIINHFQGFELPSKEGLK